MPFWSRRGRSTDAGEHGSMVAESAPQRARAGGVVVPPPRGFEDGIPLGGTTKWNPGGVDSVSRPEFMAQLYGAYLACPWASASIDVIARTITAGGIEVTPKSEPGDDRLTPKIASPEVTQLQDLFDFVNPRMDIRQLMRGVITDLLIFGDAFLEIVMLAGRPVALYPLDSPSMIPLADEHGTIHAYTQQLDPQRTADFEPHEVVQFSLDAPRGGAYGIGAMQRCLLPTTAWLFTAGLLKETMRKGDPPHLHADMPAEMPDNDIERWRQRYTVRHLGVANVGAPIVTKGGALIKELAANKIAEYIATLDQKRNEIIASMGVPPRKLSIAEPGQLGGTGEGSSSDKTFRVNTCGPYSELIMEKVNFDLTISAFGIQDWHARFGEVDWRDDKTVEDIRDQRLRNGSWSLNKYRSEIGEPAVDGGDQSVLVDRQNLVLWSDLPALSHATVAAAQAGVAAPGLPTAAALDLKTNAAKAKALKNGVGAPGVNAEDIPALSPAQVAEALLAKATKSPGDEEAALAEAWNREYQLRRRRALKETRGVNVLIEDDGEHG